MDIKELAEIKEMMFLYKERNDKENFLKYYNLFKKGYEEVTGKNLEDELKSTNDDNDARD